MRDPINWWEKAADYGWQFALVVVAAGAALVARIFRHEARILALETERAELIRRFENHEKKIDENQDRVMAAIEGLRKTVDDDNRMVIQALLERVPRP